MLTRDQILQADDLPRERVECPEWGGQVFVRMLTGAERDAIETAIGRNGDWDHVRARFAAAFICDEHGQPLFGEHDIPALSAKSAAVLDRVFDAGQRLNRMRDADLQELVGN
jgi:hypothetical protein